MSTSCRRPAAFTQIPEIVYQIFQALPARGLYTCAQVNRLWYHAASAILRRRVTCSTVFVQECVIERDDAREYCGSLHAKPSIVMLFTYEDIWLTRRDKPRRRGVERQLIKSVRHFHDELPENCKLLGCTTEKLIYHLPENFSAGPVHKKKGHVVVTLPEVQGVQYHTVHVRHLRYHTRDWSRLFRLQPDMEVKLAIVLALPHSRDMIAYIASGIRETYGERVNILGGVGHDRLFMDGTVRRTRALVLLVSGDAFSVRAGFLNQPVTEERTDFYEPARTMIRDLERSNFRPSVALVFTSRFVHRGNSYFSSAHGIFRENFPAILTGGFYSYGEFCMTASDRGKSVQECKEFMKYNSSVFCVCGYNNRVEGNVL